MRSGTIIFLASLTVLGCGGGEFTSASQSGGAGGDSGDASVGGGGSGGSAGSSGTGGSAGSVNQPCDVPTDCPPSSECANAVCNNHVCGVEFVEANQPATIQTVGDCKVRVCDGAGNASDQVDMTDIFDDNNPCTDDICTADGALNNPVLPNTPCGDGLECNAEGVCGGCTLDSECGQTTDTDCFIWRCTAGACTQEPKADDTACGLCRSCFMGNCRPVATDTDPFDQCQVHEPCGTDGKCDGSGACRFFPPTKVCGAPSCTLGVATLQGMCTGTGGCNQPTQDCGLFGCSGDVCRTTCSSAEDCVAGSVCIANVCADCLLCGEWLQNPSLVTPRCPSNSQALIDAIKSCACSTGSTGCASECSAGAPNLCNTIQFGPPSDECMQCLDSKCQSQRDSCKTDVVEL